MVKGGRVRVSGRQPVATMVTTPTLSSHVQSHLSARVAINNMFPDSTRFKRRILGLFLFSPPNPIIWVIRNTTIMSSVLGYAKQHL